MDFEILFKVANCLVFPQWALMFFLPSSKATRFLLKYQPIVIVLSVMYIFMFGQGEPNPDGNFTSLSGVMALFTSPPAVLAGWTHYLAFDMLIGSVVLADSRKRGIPHLAITPVLFLCFMAGPTGILLYGVVLLTFKFVKKLPYNDSGILDS